MTRRIDATRKRLLILDHSVAGHHPTYIRRLLESNLPASVDIVLASRKEMFVHPEILPFAGAFTPFEIESVPGIAELYKDFGAASVIRGSWTIGRLYRSTYAVLAKRMNIAFVVIPFLDDCLLGLALSRAPFDKTPWMAITMRTMFHFGAMGVVAPPQRFNAARRFLFNRLLHQPSMSALLTIDPTLAEFAERSNHPNCEKIKYLPDPAKLHQDLPTRSDARTSLKIPQDSRVVLLYGEISARKGVFSLLEAAADVSCSERLHVLLAGRYEHAEVMLRHPAYLSLMAQHRLHRVDGFLNDERERAILAASDCMWVGYTNFYLMSGVMVLAGRHALPIIASRDGLIGYWARERGIGIAVQVEQRSSVVAALNQLVLEPAALARMGENGIRVFAQHEPAVLARLVAKTFASIRP